MYYTNFVHFTLLFFYNHTENPISSADEGKSQLRQQEEVPSEVKETQAQKNRMLARLLLCTPLTASLAPLEHDPLSSVMCSEFRNNCGFYQNQKCDKSNESFQEKLFDVMLFVMQYQMVLLFVSVDEILK